MRLVRSISSYTLATLAALALVATLSAHYLDAHIISTPGYLGIVGPLSQNPTVAAALGTYTVDQLLDKTGAADALKDVLPPKAQAIIPTLIDAAQARLTQAATRIIQSDAANSAWVTVNSQAHAALISAIQRPPNQSRAGSLVKLAPVVQQVRAALGGDQAALTPEQQQRVSDLAVDLKSRQASLHQLYLAVTNAAGYLPYVTLALALLAVAVTNTRRRAVVALGALSLLAAAITLIGFKIASTNYLNGLPDQQFEPAAQVVYQAFYTPLQHSLWWAMLAAAILTVLGLLAAPFHWSQAVRTALHLPQLQTTQAYRAWTTARVWIRQYRLWFWGGLLALALIIMLTIPNLTTATAVIIVSLALIAGAAVQLVASPQATTVLD